MHIDTHAHLYPERYLDLLEQAGVPAANTKVARGIGADVTDADLSARLAMMDAAGVDMQVLSPTPQLPAGDEKSARGAARAINDMLAEVTGRFPDRFLAYGATLLPHVEATVAETARCLDELGFAGVTVNTHVDGRSLADEEFEPLWSELDRRKALVYIHATGSGAFSPMVTDHELTWVVGAPIEDTLAVLQLLRARIPQRMPGIRWHVAHLGGELTFQLQRLEDNHRDWKTLPDSPSAALREMWFDTANFHPPALRCAVSTLGADRFLLGSDFPYFQGEQYVRAAEYIGRSGLDEAEQAAILGGNARTLYGL